MEIPLQMGASCLRNLDVPMTWKPLLWIAHHLLLFVLMAALAILIGARNRRSARDLGDGRIEFAPSPMTLVALAVIVTFFAYQAIDFSKRSHGRPFGLVNAAFAGLVALVLLGGFPGTVIVSSHSLQQVYWFWRNKYIRWEDIVEINTGKKNRTVTITGADGTKIVHSRADADRSRLLLELKQHCGENLPQDFPREPIIR
jgi:hypothetical protein